MKEILNQFKLGRHEFDHGHLEGIDGVNPYELFELWMTESVEEEEKEPNAFVLSTVINDQPSSRIVYLKDIIDGNFIFYTNYLSKKGSEIKLNPKVSMLFFWPDTMRQVRIEGECTKVDPSVSDDYFNSRPRGSQIGAWASNQSEKLLDRSELEGRVLEYEEKFAAKVPRPDFWGGYQIVPTYFEFWQGRPSRLHDRITFKKDKDNWNIARLNP